MPKFRPWVKNRMMATIDSSAEIGKLMRRKRQKAERADDTQHDDEGAEAQQYDLCRCHSVLRPPSGVDLTFAPTVQHPRLANVKSKTPLANIKC